MHRRGEQKRDLARFDQTYLAGLRSWINDHGGRVYPGYMKPVYLLVQIECTAVSGVGCTDDGTNKAGASSHNNPLNVLAELERTLQPYQSMLYSAEANPTGPVQVIVTGGHNSEPYADPQQFPLQATVQQVLHRELVHWVYIDGRLDADYNKGDTLTPLVSFQYLENADVPTEDGVKCVLDPAKKLIRGTASARTGGRPRPFVRVGPPSGEAPDPPVPRRDGRPAQHRELMPQHENLGVLGGITTHRRSSTPRV